MKDENGIDDLNLIDDIGIRMDIIEMMPYLMEQAEKYPIIVEMGCQYGNGSTKALSWGLRRNPSQENEKLMISIDLNNQFTSYRIPSDSWWHFLQGSSIDPVIICTAESYLKGRKIGILFIDSDHTAQQVTAELEAWSKFCDENTLYVFHDTYAIGQFPGYTEAIMNYAKNNGFTYEVIYATGQGGAIFYKNLK